MGICHRHHPYTNTIAHGNKRSIKWEKFIQGSIQTDDRKNRDRSNRSFAVRFFYCSRGGRPGYLPVARPAQKRNRPVAHQQNHDAMQNETESAALCDSTKTLSQPYLSGLARILRTRLSLGRITASRIVHAQIISQSRAVVNE